MKLTKEKLQKIIKEELKKSRLDERVIDDEEINNHVRNDVGANKLAKELEYYELSTILASLIYALGNNEDDQLYGKRTMDKLYQLYKEVK